jgi:outer membrane protein insertion porin family
LRKVCISLILIGLIVPNHAISQVAATQPSGVMELRGRTVEEVRILGNKLVATPIILNVIRTREGDPYEPATVEEDYQRVYSLKRFSNVEAKVEATETGVIVIFIVQEQKQITSIALRGNNRITTEDLLPLVNLSVGEAIDRFRISVAKEAIANFYHEKNYPYAHVVIPPEPLAEHGELIFNIVEGPNVRVRNITFIGNKSFTADRLKGQLTTKTWIWIFRPGTFLPEQVEDDVAALRRFYESKGYFDARIGRKVIVSPDQREIQVTFVIEEGVRYTVDQITIVGNNSVSEAELREAMKLHPGVPYDRDVLQRDIRSMVRVYSPFGFIYVEQSDNPDYLEIRERIIYAREPGKVEIAYAINEGRPFKLGRILVKGNSKTQDKVVLREMRVAPGQLYNSAELADAMDRLRGTPYFQMVEITPVGDDPAFRDVLVQVEEARTASFNIGAGVSSNGGVGGNLTYEQKNFDIGNWPASPGDMFTDRAFTGAGQNFRASFEPGTEATNATLRFSEPWLFDQPYSFTGELYLRDREREDYDDKRVGGRISFGKRFNYIWSTLVTFRAENVDIDDIQDPPLRAPEILAEEGTSTLTSIGALIKRDTTDRGWMPTRGSNTTFSWDSFGLMGGDFNFQKLTAGYNVYHTLHEDLLDRKTVLSFRLDAGYIYNDAPFFENFYAGGIGSVRGFEFRGISPRAGIAEDRIGGNFMVTGSLELNFPMIGDSLRGVIFSDFGDVEPDLEFGTIRWSAGAGFRLFLPFLGTTPLAIDFAGPINKNKQDDTQIVSFSFGFVQ